MKVLMINGSPNKNGCTYTALSTIEKRLEELGVQSEILHIGKRPIQGCTACKVCKKTGECIFKDIVTETQARMGEFDAVIVGSPVYYSAPAGSLIAFLNRFFYSMPIRLAGKLGASVVSCRRGGASATFEQLNQYFTIASMPLVGSQYWNSVHGNAAEEVLQDLEGLQTMETLAENMAWLLKSVEAGRKAGVELPEAKEVIRTSFIR